MKTMINIKTDVKLKKQAQKVAKEMGLSLSVIMNRNLRDLIENRRVTFEAPFIPNAQTAKALRQSLKDIKSGKNLLGPFSTAEEMIKSLNS